MSDITDIATGTAGTQPAGGLEEIATGEAVSGRPIVTDAGIRLRTVNGRPIIVAPGVMIVVRLHGPSGAQGSPQRMTAAEALRLIERGEVLRVVDDSVIRDGQAITGVTVEEQHDSGIPDQPPPTGQQPADAAAPAPPAPAGAGEGGPVVATPGGQAAPTGPVDPLLQDLQNRTDEELEELIRERLGFLAWVLDIPELRDLVFSTLRDPEGWTTQSVVAAVQNSQWWRSTAEQARRWIQLRSEDPAQAQQMVDWVARDVQLQALRLGLSILDDRAKAIAEEALQFGWVDLGSLQPRGNLVTQAILSEQRLNPQTLGVGDLRATADALLATADEWMVPISEQSALDWAERLALGQTTPDAYDAWVRSLAESRFPHLADQFAQGLSTGRIFEPYAEQIARMLDLAPGQVDLLDDPRFEPITGFQPTDAQGNPVGEARPMTLAEVRAHVRGLPDWQNSLQGQQQAALVAENMLRAFGFR